MAAAQSPVPVDEPPARVQLARVLVIDERWAHPLRSPFWRIYLNDAAGAEVEHPAGVHRLDPGRVHLLPAWGDFRSRCRGRVPHHYLHIEPAAPLRDVAARNDVCGRWFARPLALPADARLAERVRAVAQTGIGELGARLRALAVACDCLAEGLRLAPPEVLAALERERPDRAIAPAVALVEEMLRGPLPSTALARACGLSTAHFAKVFRERTGQTPQRYLQSRRVARAAELLLRGDDPIERIATATGFANRFHFTRVFTRLMGTGPAGFRRRGNG